MKYLSILIATLFISVNVLALDLSNLSGAISELNPVQQTKDVLDSKKKCFNKTITKCKDGFNVSTDKLSCEIKMCSTLADSSTASIRKKQELFYDKSKKCYEPKIDKCEAGFELKENKCEKVLCETKPSIANSTKTTKDFLYEKKCFVTELATECAAGYELKNKDSDKTVCEKKEAKVCSSQPSLKNSTKTIDNFLYEAGNCIIEKLPTECESGYSIYKPETSSSKCKRKSKGSRRN